MAHIYKEKPVTMDGKIVNMYDGDKEIGMAAVYFVHNPNRGMDWALLEDVMVNPDYRGQGIGTELVKEIISVCQKHGCYKLVADSRFAREKVHGWYEKLGFEKHGYSFRLNFIDVPPQA